MKELRRAVTELKMQGAMMPTNGLPLPLGAKMYWPVYAEANRLGCCLSVHGGVHDRFGLDHMNMYVPVHALGHPWGLAVNCASILYNGVFDRFPRVRIAYLEGGVAWLLLLLERLHASHETHFKYIPAGEYGIREGEEPTDYIKNLITTGRFYLGIETEELTMPFAITTVMVPQRMLRPPPGRPLAHREPAHSVPRKHQPGQSEPFYPIPREAHL